MIVRQLPRLVLVVGAIMLAVVLLASGGNGYRVRVEMTDAEGLIPGSPVRAGGAQIGTVASLSIDRVGNPEAVLDLTQPGIGIGAGASAQILSTNLLGGRFVQLGLGDRKRPLASGSVIPSDRVSYPVDLDQVLNVLEPDVRARLGILIDEAGYALTDRGLDFNAMLSELPPTLSSATNLLQQVTQDRYALEHVITSGDVFLSALSPQRRILDAAIKNADELMRTTADRQQQLRATLAAAPPALREAQTFLRQLTATTLPLAPAARDLVASAPSLHTVLERLVPFAASAEPPLIEADRVAPLLTRLAVSATPVLTRTEAPLGSLAQIASHAKPLSNALGQPDGIDGVLGAVQGWDRAIQTRDSVGHVFRGSFLFTSDALRSLISRLTSLTSSTRPARPPTLSGARPRPSVPPGVPTAAPVRAPRPISLPSLADGVGQGLSKTLGGVLGLAQKLTSALQPAPGPGAGGPSPLQHLLKYLLAP